MDATLAIALVIIALLVIAGVLLMRRNQSKHLEERFGPEYHRTLDTHGDRAKAEAELREREKRVSKLDIVPLAPQDATRFRDAWNAVQARFVDNPHGVLAEADLLVRELMQKRGYPMGDFESRAADISVDHPAVVDHYRAAHAIALRDRSGEADTEMLRQAVVHYRALFADLLEVAQPEPDTARERAAAMAREREREERMPRMGAREPIAAAREPQAREPQARDPQQPREQRPRNDRTERF